MSQASSHQGSTEETLKGDAREIISILVKRARSAMACFEQEGQARVDDVVSALAWSVYPDAHSEGDAEEPATDNEAEADGSNSFLAQDQRKIFGVMRDLMRVKTRGVIEERPERGLVKLAKAVGVVGAITPGTDAVASPVIKTMMAVKGGNATIIAPSSLSWATTNKCVQVMRDVLKKMNAPADLVQIVPPPINRDKTSALMELTDLVVLTGNQNNVRITYRSNQPKAGAGLGNVPVIIDTGANLKDAAEKIAASKVFDGSTPFRLENALIILDAVYERAIRELQQAGGYMVSGADRRRVGERMRLSGKLERGSGRQNAVALSQLFQLPEEARKAKFFMVEPEESLTDYPILDDKLFLVLAVYRVRNFDGAKDLTKRILDFGQKGHAVTIYTGDAKRAKKLAKDLDVMQVIVNQAQGFGSGKGFDNGLPFALSTGFGTRQGYSVNTSLHYRCFINVTHLITKIAED